MNGSAQPFFNISLSIRIRVVHCQALWQALYQWNVQFLVTLDERGCAYERALWRCWRHIWSKNDKWVPSPGGIIWSNKKWQSQSLFHKKVGLLSELRYFFMSRILPFVKYILGHWKIQKLYHNFDGKICSYLVHRYLIVCRKVPWNPKIRQS